MTIIIWLNVISQVDCDVINLMIILDLCKCKSKQSRDLKYTSADYSHHLSLASSSLNNLVNLAEIIRCHFGERRNSRRKIWIIF